MARKRKAKPQQAAWEPVTKQPMNPAYFARLYDGKLPEGIERIEVWGSGLYQCVVEFATTGWAYITIKRQDRHAIRDWRHLQSIKNEIVGPEREAIEIFPAESRLMDTSNQYHLWVLPEGAALELGPQDRAVMTAGEIREFNETMAREGVTSRARQRAWQPGLSTGPVE